MCHSTSFQVGSQRPWTSLMIACVAILFTSGCAKTPVQSLIQELGSSDADTRYAAVKRLESLGPEAAEATTALAERLQDTDGKVRYRAAKALSKIGPGAAPATSALADALRNDDPEVVYYSAKALAKIGRPAEASGPALAAALTAQSDTKLRRVLSKAIYEVETTSPKVVPALTSAIKDPDADVCCYAVMAMSRLGGRAKSAVPAVRALAQHSDARIKQAAESALERMR